MLYEELNPYLLTTATIILINMIDNKFFNKLYPVRELYINFHLGITRVAVWFKKQLTRTHDESFTFTTINRSFFPTIYIIKGKDKTYWKKVFNEFKKEDKMPVWDDDRKEEYDKAIRIIKEQKKKTKN